MRDVGDVTLRGNRVGTTDMGSYLDTERRAAVSAGPIAAQTVPPFEACPAECPCQGHETRVAIAPMITPWKEFQSTHAVMGDIKWRARFRIARELVTIEGLCVERSDDEGFQETVEVAAAGSGITEPMAMFKTLESAIATLDVRLRKLEI
jgi:hypothetical protein